MEGKGNLPQDILIEEESSWRNMANINTWKLVCVYRDVSGTCLLATDTLTGSIKAARVFKTKGSGNNLSREGST